MLKDGKRDWLLGEITSEFLKSKLPTEKCVIRAVRYNILFINQSPKESVNVVAEKVLNLWNKHGMPCIEKGKIVRKIKKLQQTYQMLHKNKSRNTKTKNQKVTQFKSRITKLFDVAPKNFESLVSSNRIKLFLND